MSNHKPLIAYFADMSYREIGDLLGMSKSNAAKYMIGKSSIPLDRAIKIAEVTKGEVKLSDILPEIKPLIKKGYI